MSTPTVISEALHWVSLGPGDRLSIDIEHSRYPQEELPQQWTSQRSSSPSESPIYFASDFWAPEPQWAVSKDEAFRRKLANLRRLSVPGGSRPGHSRQKSLRSVKSVYLPRTSNGTSCSVKHNVTTPATISHPIYVIDELASLEIMQAEEAPRHEEEASSPESILDPPTPTNVSPLSSCSGLTASKKRSDSIVSPLSRPTTMTIPLPSFNHEPEEESWEFEINPIPPWALTHNVREFVRYELRQCSEDISVENVTTQQSITGDYSARFSIKGERGAIIAFGILSGSTWWGNYLNPTMSRML